MRTIASEPRTADGGRAAVLPARRAGAAPDGPDALAPDTLAPDALAPVGPDLFKAVFRNHANGVAIITAGSDNPVGFCATSLTSLSLNPPLASFTIDPSTTSWQTVQTAPHVMAHLLADNQEPLAHTFATPGTPKFGPTTPWHRGIHDLPLLNGVLAWLALATTTHLPVGDHVLVIGRVVAAHHEPAGRPLIHHDRTFVRLVNP
ncbi:MAG TPA: flavin reductase family protein [Gammaproteobacteria bacterium]|nr:flavin reductase family protein [Gammaproteobacteria bacterium]